ncbi:unnamed protein product, partial [Prorocentrum cordatum]
SGAARGSPSASRCTAEVAALSARRSPSAGDLGPRPSEVVGTTVVDFDASAAPAPAPPRAKGVSSGGAEARGARAAGGRPLAGAERARWWGRTKSPREDPREEAIHQPDPPGAMITSRGSCVYKLRLPMGNFDIFV